MSVKGKGVLRLAIEDFFTTVPLGIWVSSWFIQFGEWLEDTLSGHYQDVIGDIANDDTFPASIRALAKGSGGGKLQGGILQSLSFAIGTGTQAAGSFISPLMKLGEYKANKKWVPTRFDVQSAFALMWREPSKALRMISDIADQGWSEERIKDLAVLLTPRPNESMLLDLWLRGKLSDTDLKAELKARGWEDKSIEGMIELSKTIPPVNDLISMAVREAFSPDVVSKFKYDEAFPSNILEHTRKIGLTDEWVKRYWYAHWNLPSPQQGYEMLHRLRPGKVSNPFTKDDLDLLLRTADYAPYFRDKLIAISYNPLTRVDVRRMYKTGDLDYTGVLEAYKDLGYDDVNAKLLADFTVNYETSDSGNLIDDYSELSLSLVQKAYKAGLISEGDYRGALDGMKIVGAAQDLVIEISNLKSQVDNIPDYSNEVRTDLKTIIEKGFTSKIVDKDTALSTLTGLGISEDSANSLLSNAELNYTYGTRAEVINLIGKLYTQYSIDRGEAISRLGKVNVRGMEQSQILEEWDNIRDYRDKRLSQSQYQKAWLAGIISREDYVISLQGLGYTDKDIEILLALQEQGQEEE